MNSFSLIRSLWHSRSVFLYLVYFFSCKKEIARLNAELSFEKKNSESLRREVHSLSAEYGRAQQEVRLEGI